MNIGSYTGVGSQVVGRGLLVLKKYSPEILTAVGITGVVTASVLASRATLKLEPIVDDMRENLNLIDEIHAEDENLTAAKGKVYLASGLEITKLYGPAVSLGVSSIGCIIAAHGIMRKRNVALIAAYNVLEKGFSEYRKRVVEEFGPEKDRDFYYGLRTETVEDKDGKKTEVVSRDPNGHSLYAKFFDEFSTCWSKSPEENLLFVKNQQNYANDILHARGHLFLNEVYDMLGIPHTSAGALVGWIVSKDGDNFVDFNLYDMMNSAGRMFVNGLERSILLDFNVDGVIYDKI